ncbi:MAG TPA: methylmalonyl Co-A mutase-associated GTPase MeaB [Microscillaceae bacterium]|jgi:LAO/AO transport system kinase|nr:methylmalonyl Co-A mutase-associated GTPase MeaB [Microscillaceae bacterium]
MPKPRLPASTYIEGIFARNRVLLSQAITIVESQLPADQPLAQAILQAILPYTGRSVRIGITGVPGVGKSTFIESIGLYLTNELQKKMAVLAIDPSSTLSRGSILGDKTRMESLSKHPNAYIRPSPTVGSLGGVARHTREAMLLCEAAGFDIILVETVGVGQSETLVRGMCDFFLLLMLAGAGDELQGIKKGIMEMADGLVITKADGNNATKARNAQLDYQNALHLFPLPESGWSPQVLTCSAQEATGIAPVWDMIEHFVAFTEQNGFFRRQRQQQNLYWMQESIRYLLEDSFYNHSAVQNKWPEIEKAVLDGHYSPQQAALDLINLYQSTQL